MEPSEPTISKPYLRKLILVFAVPLVIGIGGYVALSHYVQYLDTPPEDFPVGKDITINSGLSVRAIADKLAEENVIRSPLYFYILFRNEFSESFAQAGTYQFQSTVSSREVAEAIAEGSAQSPVVTITFPEGFRIKDITSFLPKSFASVSVKEIEQFEGYLFPDTYFIKSDMDLTAIATLMRETFTEKMMPLQEQIQQTRFTEKDVVILASIIEREANDSESKKMVSGILQNRLEIGMPLQVDASFDYLFGKESHEVTTEDLEHNSPYNSYEYTGLPPAPISNPGLESIMAVLEPTESDYLYYLTGDDGKFYYSKTFEQHKVNKSRHLR